ncbi:FecR family protein [Celeribacter sp.]|uniref:FecR family protein n=1 Tax=Celeribacter sp. TaxID=1890673 RepID=UPI003A90247E
MTPGLDGRDAERQSKEASVLEQNDNSNREVFEQAAGWMLQLNASPEDSELRARFDAWLAQPDHQQAWSDVQTAWDALGGVDAFEPHPVSEAHNTAEVISLAARHGRSPAKRVMRGTARALGLIAALWVAWLYIPYALIALQADHRTSKGQTAFLEMADGSTIELAGASAIDETYAPAERHISLLQGEVFFDVAQDKERPFVVDASGVRIMVHGTAFNIRVTSQSTTVALLHGAVSAQIDGLSEEPAVLTPAHQIVIAQDTGAYRIEPVAPEDIGSWRDGRIFLSDVTLAEAAEIIGRAHSAWVSIPSDALARQQVSGFFDLSEPDASLDLLAASFGAHVRHMTPYLRVISEGRS